MAFSLPGFNGWRLKRHDSVRHSKSETAKQIRQMQYDSQIILSRGRKKIRHHYPDCYIFNYFFQFGILRGIFPGRVHIKRLIE